MASAASTEAPLLAGAAARQPDPARRYQPARGFAYRPEPFGGVLYWYEGTQPDPHVTFVDSPFLLDLLDLVPQAPLGEVVAAVVAHFSLSVRQQATVRRFLHGLIAKGALVPG